jgi:hypothetical protein
VTLGSVRRAKDIFFWVQNSTILHVVETVVCEISEQFDSRAVQN